MKMIKRGSLDKTDKDKENDLKIQLYT